MVGNKLAGMTTCTFGQRFVTITRVFQFIGHNMADVFATVPTRVRIVKYFVKVFVYILLTPSLILRILKVLEHHAPDA